MRFLTMYFVFWLVPQSLVKVIVLVITALPHSYKKDSSALKVVLPLVMSCPGGRQAPSEERRRVTGERTS